MAPSSNTPHAAVRLWPVTALVVTLALLLMLVDGFNAAIQVAPFFGKTTWLTWCAVGLFSLGAVATHQQRRRARRPNRGSAA